MATASFKTPCPSCEAGVLVKDPSLIGKKIDCPKCKYRFVVEGPNGKEKSPATKKPPVPSGKGKPDVKAPPGKTKPSAKVAKDEDTEQEDRPKKKTLASNKMMLILAGAGVLVLAIGAFLLFGKKDTGKKNPGVNPNPPGRTQTPGPGTVNENSDDAKKPKTNAAKPTPKPALVALSPAGPELTNLLPGQAQHITHVFVKDTLDLVPLLASAAIRSGPFGEDGFKQKLGFSLKSMDDLIRAENYTDSWTFTVVHLNEAVKGEELKEGLGLQPAPGSPANGREFFQVTKNVAWLEQFGRMAIGTLAPPVTAKEKEQPLFLRIHDPQTLVFADAVPMNEYLARTAPPSAETYGTLKNPALKAMLDKMEKLPAGSPDRVLASSVTDLQAARLPAPAGRVQWRFRPLWDVTYALADYAQRLRLLGTVLLRRGIGDPATYRYQNEIECVNDTDLRGLEKDLREKVAPEVSRFLELFLRMKVAVADEEGNEQSASPMTPGPSSTPPPRPSGRPPAQPGGRPPAGFRPPGGRPGGRPPAVGGRPPAAQVPNPGPMANGPKEPVKVNDGVSHIVIAGNDKSVVFTLHVVLDEKTLPQVVQMADLLMLGLRGQLAAASALGFRNDLARAVKRLGEQPGGFPPGLFPRKNATSWSARDPEQRISWMAGLLPYLGQETLFNQYIKFDASWKDRSNWMAASTLIPEFLDPSYPEWARRAAYPGVPFPLGGTHFVGIAGVGRGAAEYAADDPAVAGKLGVFGYDRATSLEEIRKNRGLSHTGVMVQVPYDGPAGVTPWMAGGGSTIRGVPETNSVQPFVSTKLNGKAGTYLLMADGSVRFVGADVKDEVFKAICTIRGPADFATLDRELPAVKASKTPLSK